MFQVPNPKVRLREFGAWGLDFGISKKGWSTGLEPATTRTTIWGSTIELRPPSGIQILVFRRMIANAQRTPPVWHTPRFSLTRCPIFSLQPTFHLLSSAPAFHEENPLDPARHCHFLSGLATLDRRIG